MQLPDASMKPFGAIRGIAPASPDARERPDAGQGSFRGGIMPAGNYCEEEAGHGRVYSVRRV